MSRLQPIAMSGMPRLTSYSSPQVPPSTPLTGLSSSPFDGSLTTVSSKAIGVASLNTDGILSSLLDDLVSIRIVNQTTAQPAAGLSAKLTAVDICGSEPLESEQPFAIFIGVTNSEGRITSWRSHGSSTAELSERLTSNTIHSKWLWILHLESGKYWSSLELETSVPEAIVKFHTQSTLENQKNVRCQVSVLLGQWNFAMYEGNHVNYDLT